MQLAKRQSNRTTNGYRRIFEPNERLKRRIQGVMNGALQASTVRMKIATPRLRKEKIMISEATLEMSPDMMACVDRILDACEQLDKKVSQTARLVSAVTRELGALRAKAPGRARAKSV